MREFAQMSAFWWLIAIAVAISILIPARPRYRRWRGPYPRTWDSGVACIDQVAAVTEASVRWRRKPVLNHGERAVFHAATTVLSELNRYWQAWPQVSLGEVLVTEGRSAADREAHRWINSKRCDFVVVDPAGLPLAVIEYQGGGHDQGDAAMRDRVKRTACERASIAYFEVPAHLTRPAGEGHLRAHLMTQFRPMVEG